MSQPDDTLVSRRTQTVAWVVVLTSLAMFLLICGLSTVGTYWFFFLSTVHLKVDLSVSHGAVVMQIGDVASNVTAPNYEVEVPTSAVITVPSDSQGYLTIEDATTHEVLATAFMMPNTVVTLQDTLRPRFNWSKGAYSAVLSGAAGQLSIDIPRRDGPNRQLYLRVDTPQGTAYLTQEGRYTLDMSADRLNLFTRYGQAILYRQATRAALVQPGFTGSISNGNVTVTTQPSSTQTILGFGYVVPLSIGLKPSAWDCRNSPPDNPNEPEGQWRVEAVDGPLAVMHMSRFKSINGPDLHHAETSCSYSTPDPDGQDLTAYKTLSIRARLRISLQDVTTCGILGTECPVMIELHYVNRNGEDRYWRQGFYAIRPDGDPWPQRCDTCPSLHEQVNKDEWFIYDSGDLLTQFPGLMQPAFVTQVRVYASGHQYDVAVSELALLGGTG